MGQGLTRSTSTLDDEVSSDSITNNSNDNTNSPGDPLGASHSAAYLTTHAKTTNNTPIPSFLHPVDPRTSSAYQPRKTAGSSAPKYYGFHGMHLFQRLHSPSAGAKHKKDQHRAESPIPSPQQQQSEPAATTARTTYASVASDYASGVSASEAQQHRDAQYLDKMLVRTAEEIAAVPAGELECLASGFLSIADYIYVAVTIEGLSNLLMCEDELIAQYIDAVAAGTHAKTDSGSLDGTANSPVTPPVTPPDSGVSELSTVGALINTTAANVLTELPWSLMRDALLTRRAAARAKSASGVSQKTLASPHTMASGDSFQPEGSKTTKRSDSPNGAASSTQTGSLPETGLTDTASPNANLSSKASTRTSGVMPLSTTLGGSANLSKSSTATWHSECSPRQQQAVSASHVDLVAAETVRPLSLDDLVSITMQDEVLDVFLESMGNKIRGLSKKQRVLSPFATFRYCIARILRGLATAYESSSAGADEHPLVSRSRNTLLSSTAGDDKKCLLTAGTHVGAKGNGADWIYAETVVLAAPNKEELSAKQARKDALIAMGDDVRHLFNDTKGLLLKMLTSFANAMPLGINSRINNNYLLPTEPIPASFIGCGVNTRRRKDFFVSMAERTKMLQGHNSFRSPEAMLLGLSQLSNLASQMLSIFAIGAVLSCVQRWRELHEAGITNTDEIPDLMEQFATQYCTGFDILCNEAFPALRKQYPNVFVISSFVIHEEEGGRPPMVTVAVSAILKLLFLFAGGLESIRADDRRLLAAALREERKRKGGRMEQCPSTKTNATSGGSLATQSPSASHKLVSEPASRHVSSSSLDNAHDSHETSSADRHRTLSPSGECTSNSSSRSQISTTLSRFTDCTDKEGGAAAMTDDVALATALHVQSASVLVLLGTMLLNHPLTLQAPTTSESMRLAHAVSRMWRVLFQTAGLLPHGTACPKEMSKWLPMFPMYAVSTEAKRVLVQVYAKTANFNPLCIGPIQREDVLQSTANVVCDIVRASCEVRGNAGVNGTAAPAKGQFTPRENGLSTAALDLNRATRTSTDDGTVSRTSTDAAGSRERMSLTMRSINRAVAATLSHQLIPVFLSRARRSAAATQLLYGLRAGYRVDESQPNSTVAKELRQYLYDITARQVVDPFLSAVNLTRETRTVPLPGGLASFHTATLEDHAEATLQQLQVFKDRLVLFVAWKKSAVAAAVAAAAVAAQRGSRGSVRASQVPSLTGGNSRASGSTTMSTSSSSSSLFVCPIRPGDEITIHWGDPMSSMTAKAPLSPLPAPQRHVVVAVLRTTSSFQYLVVLDSPNYLSSYYSPTSAAATAPLHAHPVTGRCQDSSLTASLSKGFVNRRQSTVSLQSIGLGYIEDAAADAPSIVDVLLYRRQTPVFIRDGATPCAWTNPKFVLGQVNAVPRPPQSSLSEESGRRSCPTPPQQQQPQHRSSSAVTVNLHPEEALPMMLGWLLGQAPGNEVTFALPLPPLAFHILSDAVRLEESVEDVNLDAADLSLQNPDFTKIELCQRTLEEVRRYVQAHMASIEGMADSVHFSGSPAVVRRHYQRLKTQLKEILVSMSWNGRPAETVMRGFWSALLQGMRQTPLVDTPIFAQCCARTLRNVLCGTYDSPDLDFSFRKSFLLLTNLNAPLNAYRNYVRKCVKGVLDEEFSISEKRLLLRFITGHTLRSRPAYAEMIYVDVQHTFAGMLDGLVPQHSTLQLANPRKSVPVTRAAIDATLQLLPVGRSTESTLVIPNYFEALMMGSYRGNVLGADYPWMKQQKQQQKHGDTGAATTDAEGTAVAPATDAKEGIVLEENDFQCAWAGLTPAQQETLKRRFRELLVHRLRAALYAFLVGHDDSIEASWELAEKLGLVAAPGASSNNTNEGQPSEDKANHSSAAATACGGTFMRRHDGTLVFIDNGDAMGLGAMDDYEELPFDDEDDDDDLADDTYSEFIGSGLEETGTLLENSSFRVFGEAQSADDQSSVKNNSPKSKESETDTTTQSQSQAQAQPIEDSAVKLMDQNGYRSAASFCFDDDADVPPPELEAKANGISSMASDDDDDDEGEVAAVMARGYVSTKDDNGESENSTGNAEQSATSVGSGTNMATTETLPAETTVAVATAAAAPSSGKAPAVATAEEKPVNNKKRNNKSSRITSAGLVPMAVAPARHEPIVTSPMSTLLQHARVADAGTAPTSSPTTRPPACGATTSHLPNTETTAASRATAQRPSYSLGVPTSMAAVMRATPRGTNPHATSPRKNDPLMAEVDSGIRELFPDDDFVDI